MNVITELMQAIDRLIHEYAILARELERYLGIFPLVQEQTNRYRQIVMQLRLSKELLEEIEGMEEEFVNEVDGLWTQIRQIGERLRSCDQVEFQSILHRIEQTFFGPTAEWA